MQQLLVEGLLLSGGGDRAGGTLLAHGLNKHLPLPVSSTPNGLLLLALLGLTIVSTYAPIEPELKQGGQQSGASQRHNRVRGSLVIAEIAMSLMLLVAALGRKWVLSLIYQLGITPPFTAI